METRKYEITLTEQMLGSKPMDAEVFSSFVASKKLDDELKSAPPSDELKAAARTAEIEGLEKGMTVFHRDEDGKTPILWDYQVKGFFKSACESLRRDGESKSAAVKAYKKIIDGNVFVYPRKIALKMPKDGKVGVLERPLRAQTMQGERVALAKSETVPEGTKFTIEVKTVGSGLFSLVEEWLDYGELRGIGQWRNGSFGRFTWKRV